MPEKSCKPISCSTELTVVVVHSCASEFSLLIVKRVCMLEKRMRE